MLAPKILIACSATIQSSPKRATLLPLLLLLVPGALAAQSFPGDRHLMTVGGFAKASKTFVGDQGCAILGDLDGDGHAEIGYGTRADFQVVSGRTGCLLYVLPDGACCQGNNISQIGDLDRDKVPEILTGPDRVNSNAGAVRLYSGRTGKLIHQWNGAAGSLLGTHVSDVGDVDGDGLPDVGAGTGTGGTFVVYSSATKMLLHRFVALNSGWPTIGRGAGDIDGDGRADVLVGTMDSGTVELRSGKTGALIGKRITGPGSSLRGSFPRSIAAGRDVDGDGTPDVVVGHHRPNPGNMRVYSGKTQQLIRSFQLQGLGRQVAWIGDITGDGRSEVVAATGSGVAVFDVTPKGKGLLFELSGLFSLGWDVGGGGDVNGDKIPDFVAAAPYNSALPFGSSVRVYSGKRLRLSSDVRTLPTATGGKQVLHVHTGTSVVPDHFWLVLGSLSGTSPCTQLGPVCLKLKHDAYFDLTLGHAPAFGLIGRLNSSSAWHGVTIQIPALPSSFVGTELHYASLRIDANPFRIHAPSEPTILTLK